MIRFVRTTSSFGLLYTILLTYQVLEQSTIQSKRRLTEHSVIFRRVQLREAPSISRPTSQPPTPRRFHFSRDEGTLILVEKKDTEPLPLDHGPPKSDSPPPSQSNLRKRPGASVASKGFRAGIQRQIAQKGIDSISEPSAEAVNELEQLAAEVDQTDIADPSPIRKAHNSKFKPRVPALRYKDRHSDHSKQQDAEAMDVDIEGDYVYDTYVQDIHMADALTEATPEPKGTFGFIVITDEDEDFWDTYGQDDESEKEFDTDDEDENAEGYYGADYPEDEVASDDEYDANPYQYNHGDDEEYDAENGAWSDEGDDLRYPWKRDAHSRITHDHETN